MSSTFAKFRILECLFLALALARTNGAQTENSPVSLPKRTDEVSVTTRANIVSPLTASSVRILSARQLEDAPGFALDDRLRQIPGIELFRRTSSWIANPTTQGISLRGLGSTAASRTLVLTDEIPLNDAFGGWVRWNEIPQLAIESVEVLRGGASDLYGSSAIGGVINERVVKPVSTRAAARLGYGSLDTPSIDLIGTGIRKRFALLAAASDLATDGYILVEPAARGPIDRAYNVHAQSGRIEMHRSFMYDTDIFVRGNVLNEARDNGTPAQKNATRNWRFVLGGDTATSHGGHAFARLYGGHQNYRQSFSAIALDRASENYNRLQHVPIQELGVAAQWAQQLTRWLTLVAGMDLRDVRATDQEQAITAGIPAAPAVNISARQRDIGGYVEALVQHSGWSLSASVRLDSFRTFDAARYSITSTATYPSIEDIVANPRVGLVRTLAHGIELTASAFRAFRGPTMNELYRNGQVGQELTLANPSLRSERATGAEAGVRETFAHRGGIQISYFWTVVNRPITALTLSQTPNSVTKQRDNLGQIRSRGLSMEGEYRAMDGVSLTAGYQFAEATVTRFDNNPTLIGKWIPEVARHAVTAQVRVEKKKLGNLTLLARNSGRVYDDASNINLLHGFFRLDGNLERTIGSHASLYVSAQNILNRSIDAGRTPVLTLAAPRVIAGGLRMSWGK